MQIGPDPFFHLTYCTNIHRANGWDAVLAALQRHVPPIRARVAGEQPFGLGLRLSDRECRELAMPGQMDTFKRFLQENNSYLFTLNGFPYGPFHATRVKAGVYQPDWSQPERVAYTRGLAQILAALLPDALDGGISTVPLGYARGPTALWQTYAHNFATAIADLVQIRRSTGKLLHLDIEPEPDCLIEDSRGATTFFEQHLLTTGAEALAQQLGCGREEARQHLYEHWRLCLDACHLAVVFESPANFLKNLDACGLQVGKVQLSSALRVMFPAAAEAREALRQDLRPFAESVYLHQVVARTGDGTVSRYADLDEALAAPIPAPDHEWRIHFHVPVFLESYGAFASTQPQLLETLQLVKKRRLCRHLEIETYTWDVLPEALKTDLDGSITREFAWVRTAFDEAPQA